jgi:hypothetical protein
MSGGIIKEISLEIFIVANQSVAKSRDVDAFYVLLEAYAHALDPKILKCKIKGLLPYHFS